MTENISTADTVPLKIFQTWFTKDLTEKMRNTVEELKNNNPEFEHFLFDDKDCEEFIHSHFNEKVVNAFRRLIPCAYKADLWRYCVMYIHGGIYLDIKLRCVNGFKFINSSTSLSKTSTRHLSNNATTSGDKRRKCY